MNKIYELEDCEVTELKRIDTICQTMLNICSEHRDIRPSEQYCPEWDEDYVGGDFSFGNKLNISINAYVNEQNEELEYHVITDYVICENPYKEESRREVVYDAKAVIDEINKQLDWFLNSQYAKDDTTLPTIIYKIKSILAEIEF